MENEYETNTYYYEGKFVLDTDNSSDESGDFGPDYNDPCERELSGNFHRIFLPTIYGIIFFLGIVGNGLVVVVMCYQKKIQGKIKPPDKYRLHLSVADLLLVLTLPFWAVEAASADGDWYFGNVLCVSVHVIYTLNVYSSVLILAFISLDRYLAVVRATNSKGTRDLLAEKVIYVGVWLPAFLLTVPDLVFATTRKSMIFTGREDIMDSRVICERVYPQASSTVLIAVFRFLHILVGFVLPGLIIFICYCIIVIRLSHGSKGQVLKKKAMKTTVILILCFFCCWLPYCLGIFVDTLIRLDVIPSGCEMDHGVQTWISITEALAYFHCCMNPILYAFLGVTFKKSAKSALNLSSKSSQRDLMSKKRGAISSVSESESSSVLSS